VSSANRTFQEYHQDSQLENLYISISLLLRLENAMDSRYDPHLLHSPTGRLLTHVLPNSLHFRHGILLSHFTFNLEHSSQACRLRPRSKELGIAEFPLRSHRLKWSLRTSLEESLVSEYSFARNLMLRQ
jgi:hypothetical protein